MEDYEKKGPQAGTAKPKGTEEVLNWVAQQGRGGDTMLAHVSRGEVVVPNALLDAEDAFLRQLLEGVMKEYGYDPGWFTVGHELNSINPETGLPEFGWLSKAWKKVTKPIKKVAKAVTKVVKKVVKAVAKPVKAVVKAVAKPVQQVVKAVTKPFTPKAPEPVEQPSTATATTALGDGTYEEVTSGKQKKSAALRRRSRGKRRLRVGNQMSIGTTGSSGVGTGGSSGSSVNVPKG